MARRFRVISHFETSTVNGLHKMTLITKWSKTPYISCISNTGLDSLLRFAISKRLTFFYFPIGNKDKVQSYVLPRRNFVRTVTVNI